VTTIPATTPRRKEEIRPQAPKAPKKDAGKDSKGKKKGGDGF